MTGVLDQQQKGVGSLWGQGNRRAVAHQDALLRVQTIGAKRVKVLCLPGHSGLQELSKNFQRTSEGLPRHSAVKVHGEWGWMRSGKPSSADSSAAQCSPAIPNVVMASGKAGHGTTALDGYDLLPS